MSSTLDDVTDAVTDPGGHDPAALVTAAVTAAVRDGLPPGLLRAAVDLAAGAGDPEGLTPTPSADEVRVLAGLAVTLTAAGNVPKAIRDKPNDAFLVMLEGRTLGLAPTTALRTLHVIDGKVTVPPMVKLAQLHRSGLGRAWAHQPPRQGTDGTTVVCACGDDGPGNDEHGARWHAIRADAPDLVHGYAFTWDDARRAELADQRCTPDNHAKVHNGCACKDNWRKYPARMVSWRALGYLLDDVFPEVGAGLYSPDELGAVTDEDGRAIDVTGWEAPAGLNRARSATPKPPAPPAAMADDADVLELAAAARALDVADPQLYADLRAWWGSAGTSGSRLEPGACTAVAARAARARLEHYARQLATTIPDLAADAATPPRVDEFEPGDSDPGAPPIDAEAREVDPSPVDEATGGGEAPTDEAEAVAEGPAARPPCAPGGGHVASPVNADGFCPACEPF